MVWFPDGSNRQILTFLFLDLLKLFVILISYEEMKKDSENTKFQSITIDLNQFKFHIDLKTKIELTLHFNSPSRRFYLSLIAFVVNEMKRQGKMTSIPLEGHHALLALLNETVGGSAGSSEKENLLPRIYRKWKDALPNLEEAPLFKVLGRKKEYDEGISRTYSFSEDEKDRWANLFEYIGSEENVRLKFAVDKIGVTLDNVQIVYEDKFDGDAWERFLSNLRENTESKPDDFLTTQESVTPGSSSTVPGAPVESPRTGAGVQDFLEPPDPRPGGIDDSEPKQTISEAIKPEIEEISPTAEVSPPRHRIGFRQTRYRWIALAALFVMIAGTTVFGIWKLYFKSAPIRKASVERMAFPLPDKPSIAVLPFVNMSDDPKQEFFSDGLTEEIITVLSKSPNLFVIARTSTFAYKGKPVRVDQVAEELGVRYVLEGSVRRAGEKIRINAQLIDATTGHHLWAERYDGTLKDVFALEDQITGKIATALAAKLRAEGKETAGQRETDNVAAYDEFLRGWEHYLRFTSDDLALAVQSFKKAIEFDPNYGRAYAALALTYWSGSNVGIVRKGLGVPYGEARLSARKYLKEAMKSPSSIARQVNSQFYLYQRRHEEAVSELQQAIGLDPNDPVCNASMGRALLYDGKPKEAVDFLNRAMRLDPHNPARYLGLLGGAHFCMGNLEEAATLVEKSIRLNPEISGMAGWLLATYGLLGREKETRAAWDIYTKERTGTPQVQGIMYFFPFKDRVVADRFSEGLKRAGVKGRPGGYFPAYRENRLSGDQIKRLLFGSTITGFSGDGQRWSIERKRNGDIAFRGSGPISADAGKSWIEGDTLCQQYQKSYWGLEICSTVFRNPKGTYEGKDEYFLCRDTGFLAFSVVR